MLLMSLAQKKEIEMNKFEIDINNYKKITIAHIVLDYNGTLAKDGLLKEGVKTLLPQLSKLFAVHVITADTFGSVHKQLEAFDVNVKVLESKEHTKEKAAFIQTLGASLCAAVGNGNNDVTMLETAELGIALIGDEGCATKTLLASDVVCHTIEDALELFTQPKRLIATLRK